MADVKKAFLQADLQRQGCYQILVVGRIRKEMIPDVAIFLSDSDQIV
ncbi:unnamed protein product, partial [Onchocerca ochengi]|uniref:CobW C-terminal domain-containing protein n=1 Tax=Onchocerca ochengi TaxID=42157 RepID=A0A182EY01_ONCOC